MNELLDKLNEINSRLISIGKRLEKLQADVESLKG